MRSWLARSGNARSLRRRGRGDRISLSSKTALYPLLPFELERTSAGVRSADRNDKATKATVEK